MSTRGSFSYLGAFENNANTNNKISQMISRKAPMYNRDNEIRTQFGRDYTRIIHCQAYRRLKNKTQVFFSPQSDHICTRIEHVNHVESISYTIANYLGLNTELTKAIAVAHDLGHSPFGHAGEKILNEISKNLIGQGFWHEKNGLHCVDNIELLEDCNKESKNLNLTYAVRDGIISHCGEDSKYCYIPRDEFIDLEKIKTPNEYSPFTWEGCVVKIADRISYVGRDIEDALTLGILTNAHQQELENIIKQCGTTHLNNTVIINHLVNDLCNNSTPEKGIGLSSIGQTMLKKINAFNYANIYHSKRVKNTNDYFKMVLTKIFEVYLNCFDNEKTLDNIKLLQKDFPVLASRFYSWLGFYMFNKNSLNTNKEVFNISNRDDYIRAIISYISGMTDKYAIDTFNEIITF